MKKKKSKSIFALILFSVLTLGLASIATSAVTRITDNAFEDSLPKTAGGYVVWQGQSGIDGDWEIFLYNANDGSGPFQITDNTYGDTSPDTDGRYITWQAGAALHGEIFLYDIATGTTTRISDDVQADVAPKIVNGKVVWVSHSVGVDTLIGPGDIILYDIAAGVIYNISADNFVDPNNDHDDYAFRFDGSRILWTQNTNLGDFAQYVYDLVTNKIYRYIFPPDPEDDTVSIPYLEDVVTGEITYLDPGGLTLQDNPRSDGDLTVSATSIGGSDREIVLSDYQIKRGDQITSNWIEDTQPVIKDNIVVWKGGEGNSSEIYLYEIQPLFANAGYDFEIDIANVDQMVIRGKAGGGANHYRWLLGTTDLTGWIQVVGGQAPLDLANMSGFASGPQTLTLEVSDGQTIISDKVTMTLQDWPLGLVLPADSSEQVKGTYPEFTWVSSYRNFKIQISPTPGFGDAETVTYPSGSDEWMIGSITSFTPDAATTQELDDLLSESSLAYWKIVARDAYGNKKASETRSFIIIPPVRPVSPKNRFEMTKSDFKKEPPVFVWESSEDYIQFKIQFSIAPSFEGQYTRTFPESDDVWLNEPSITLDKKQAADIISLLEDNGNHPAIYWRVLAKDNYGNEEISEIWHIYFPNK
jgi:hypothetical protein